MQQKKVRFFVLRFLSTILKQNMQTTPNEENAV